MPVSLEVFANTGHQYFSFPLSDVASGGAKKKSGSELEALAVKNRGSFERLAGEMPWIRYQFDLAEDRPEGNRAVLRLAIETNLGLNTRGFLFNVDEVDEKPPDDFEVAHFAGRDDTDLESSWGRKISVASVPTKDGGEFPVDLNIEFVKPGGQDWIDVDLIVDLGNTRTAAILLESPGTSHIPLDQRIYPLRILPRGTQYELLAPKPVSSTDLPSMLDDCAIIQSWLLLRQTLFSSAEPPSECPQVHTHFEEFKSNATGKTRYRKFNHLPQSFVEISPALIGGGKSREGAARVLAYTDLETDAPFFLSSPKRYVWDDQPQGQKGNTFWFSITNTDSQEFRDGKKIIPLSGLIRYFMEPSGHDWKADRTPNAHDFTQVPYFKANPTYPRQAAVCWFALSLIEAAYRQINAQGYRNATGRKMLPRRLRWVRVTFPAGWTSEEKALYFKQWKRAIDLFALTHLEAANSHQTQSPPRPMLAEDLMDEAVCSQLPIIYAHIQTLMNDGRSWIDLYGNGSNLVVMNLDIGGGTTDMAIIQYQNKGANHNASLTCKLLFRFGKAIAGDMVVKAVIEKVLIPAWIKASDRGQYTKYPRATLALENLFGSPSFNVIRQVDPFMPRKLARITRLVFAPLANYILQKMTERDEDSGTNVEPLVIKDESSGSPGFSAVSAKLIEQDTLNELNNLCIRTIRHYCYLRPDEQIAPPFSDQARIVWKPEQINDCIKEVFSSMFNNLGLLAARFKCHLVIVSGKPSELPLVRKLINEAFPIMPQRIMTVKDFPAGRWYPFATPEGKIQDAKTCTVVGAALFQELVNGALRDFNIAAANENDFFKQYYWGIIPSGGKPDDFYRKPNLLFSPSDYRNAGQQSANRIAVEKTFNNVPLDCRIGRQITRLKDVPPDPVYELAWERTDSEARPSGQVTATVTLRWVSVRGEGEQLELVNVIPENNAKVNPHDVRLKLNTLLSRDFWMDSPEFDTRQLFTHLSRPTR
jgi:hypothetical protein